MGKLTESLRATTKQLSDLKQGINEMQELGQELVDNTLQVADAALRTGYAYAQAEVEMNQTAQSFPHSLQEFSSNAAVLDSDHLNGATQWTEKLLKARFGNCATAYRHLCDVHGIKLSKRSWQTIVDAFNGAIADRPLEQRVADLEQVVKQQGQYIVILEEKLKELAYKLEPLLANDAGSLDNRSTKSL